MVKPPGRREVCWYSVRETARRSWVPLLSGRDLSSQHECIRRWWTGFNFLWASSCISRVGLVAADCGPYQAIDPKTELPTDFCGELSFPVNGRIWPCKSGNSEPSPILSAERKQNAGPLSTCAFQTLQRKIFFPF